MCQQVRKLVRLFGGECHYCGEQTNYVQNHPRQATKEHVVPRFFGGHNSMSNYVLACKDCNNKRGTLLWFCDCIYCGPLIEDALNNQDNFDAVFFAMVKFNRPAVKRAPHPNCPDLPWLVKRGVGAKRFATFEEALINATNEREFSND